MERYKEYKKSESQWLGVLPQHWEERKMKYCFIERSEKNHPDEPILCATQSQGVIPQSMYANRVVVVNKGFEGLKLVKEGDFVISLRSFEGGIEYAYYQGIISAAYTILCPRNNQFSKFWKYLFKSQPYIELLQTCVTGIREGQNINYPMLSRKFVPVPPLAEQEKIVNYLDSKTLTIDAYVAERERELRLLNELKETEIANVVTQGLNPNVKMKDSGIPWIGMIPEHWEVVKLKVFCKENKEKNTGLQEKQVLSLSYGNVIIKQDINSGLVPESYDTYQIVNPGYIILRLTDLQNDHKSLRTGLVKDRGIITNAYVGLIVQKISPAYTRLLLHSFDLKKLFYSMGGGLRQSMSYKDVANLVICVPPLDEQRAIVAHIENKCSKVNSLITELEAEIEYLKEYKQRLIADCVTGQINVQ